MAEKEKSGGRKKGTPNKKTEALKGVAERLGVDPFEVLILFAGGRASKLGLRTIEPSIRARCAAEASSYLYPKRKAVELTGKDGGPVAVSNLTDEQIDQRIEQLLKGGKHG